MRLWQSCLLLCFLSASISASAQVLTPASQQGSPANTSDDLHGVDSVNTMGLSLHIEIPLLTLQERGRTYTWKYVYNSPTYEIVLLPTPTTPGTHSALTGDWVVAAPPPVGNPLWRTPGPDNWILVNPTSWSILYDTQLYDSSGNLLTCEEGTGGQGTNGGNAVPYQIQSNFRLLDPSGTSHPLGMSATQFESTTDLTTRCGQPADQLASPTLDGSGAYVDITQSAFWLADGTKYSLTPYTGSYAPPNITKIEDANGNIIGPDMMKRSGLSTVSTSSTQTVYQYSDSNGLVQQITVTYASVSIQTNECSLLGTFQGTNPCTEASGSFHLPSSIQLPNGSSYQFQYKSGGHGELMSMTLPTGATISYTYQQIVAGGVNARGGTEQYRYGVSTRSESVNGNTSTWSYTYNGHAATTGTPAYTTVVQDPLGNCVTHAYSALAEYATTYQQGCGAGAATIKTVTTDYADDAAAMPGQSYGTYNLRPTSVTTTLSSGQASQVQTDYETFTFGTGLPGSWLNPTEIREYDFGASTPTRTTDYTYLHNTGSSTRTAAQYQANHLVRQVSTKTVSNSAGPLLATSYDYDNYGAGIAASGAVNRDSSYGNWGNATKQTVTDKLTGVAYSSSYLYEDTGNMIQATDPRGYSTNYSYADSWSNASCALPSGEQGHIYLTKVTNALNQSNQYAYNSCSGSIASVTDANSKSRTMQYDLLGRTTEISMPDGGKTSYSYVDQAPVSMTMSQTLNASQSSTLTTEYDGLGRKIQTQLTSDPSGTDYVDTAYDGVGNLQSISNPHRSASSATDGTTTFAYDALGRKIIQTQPDNNTLQWCYDGLAEGQSNCLANKSNKSVSSWVDYSNEKGSHWQRVSDALGRLTAVMEPSAGSSVPSLETDYSYNVLDNLTNVSQLGISGEAARTRNFTYDSFSRLLTSSNPETGTVCYGQWSGSSCINGYDTNGNLVARTDARGVITSYSYDALNRLLSKAYINDISGTLSSCYQYDLSSVPNGVGRLTTQWTQSASAGACSLSNPTWTKRAILQYDPMGRVLSEQQYTPATVASGKPYTPAYTYDLAGNLISSTDGVTPTPTTPGSPLTFTYCIDGANHLQTLSSNWIDSTHPQSLFSAQVTGSSPCVNTSSPTLSSPTYAAFGGITSTVLGKGLTITRGYDNRLRFTAETATGGATSVATIGSATITVSGAEQSQ